MRTLTFRQIFICLCVLVSINICVNLFTGAAAATAITPTPVEHDGVCPCDGLDPNCTLMDDVFPSLDETVKMLKDFQLDYQYNGDIIIYSLEGNHQVYVGVWKKGSKCDLIQMMNQYIMDND